VSQVEAGRQSNPIFEVKPHIRSTCSTRSVSVDVLQLQLGKLRERPGNTSLVRALGHFSEFLGMTHSRGI
jgi:hypothetical protein